VLTAVPGRLPSIIYRRDMDARDRKGMGDWKKERERSVRKMRKNER